MPAAVQADWNLIQQLYVSGLSPKDIEAKTGVKAGTVSVRANRCNWRKTAEQTALILRDATSNSRLTKADQEQDSLSLRSKASRDALAKALNRFADKLEGLKVPTGEKALKLASDLEPLVRSCKTVFGWSEGQSQPAVRINVLSGLTLSVSQPADPSAQSVPEPSTQPVLEAEVMPESQSNLIPEAPKA